MTVTAATRPTAPAERVASTTTLTGRWLAAARVAWVIVFVGQLSSFALGLPEHFYSLSHACSGVCRLTEQQAAPLIRMGVSLTAYAWISLALVSVIILISAALALILFRRRSHDWMVLLVSVFLVAYPMSNIATGASGAALPVIVTIILQVLIVPVIPAYCALLWLFPNGRFAPRWSWILLVFWGIWAVIANYLSDVLSESIVFIGLPFFVMTAIVLQIYRYRHASTPAQRQQMKWAFAGLVTTLVASMYWVPLAFIPVNDTLYLPIAYLLYQLVALALPITFFIAIQRHRLYEIDTIINRTLVYGSVTLVLAAVYVGCIVAFQAISRTLLPVPGRADEPIVIVISTLLIAALFQPLRRRIQRVVDRRFYRTRYDARKAVEAFGTALRQEVDISSFSEQLLGVVQQTMEPAHLSLWLSEAPGRRNRTPS